MSVDEIVEHLHAYSLAFLSLEGTYQAIDAGEVGFCSACITGHYPTLVPVALSGSHSTT